MMQTKINEILETIVPYDDNIGSKIFFEPLSMSGLEEMHKYSTDERLYEFFEFKPFKTVSDTKKYISKLLERMNKKEGYIQAKYWFIRNKTDNKLIGTANLININYSRKSVEWGYGINPELWGKGYILKIQEMLKKYVFEILKFNRLYGVTMINNERTISSILSCGMVEEGILRDFYCKDGDFIDGWSYSMIGNDYFKNKNKTQSINTKYSENKILNLISSVLTEESIDINSNMDNTYSWDSMSHLHVLTTISDKTGLIFTSSEIASANSVKSIINIVKQRTIKK